MINVHILDLADTSACYNGSIKHILELACDLQDRGKLRVHILVDDFDEHFKVFTYQYMKLMGLARMHQDKVTNIELNMTACANGTPEGWLIDTISDSWAQPSQRTFESMLKDSRKALEVFIIPWRIITGPVFQKIAERMYEENIHADIIVPVTKSATLVTMNPMLYPTLYDYRYNSIWKPFKKEDYDHRKLAGDPYHIEKIINSDMLKHYIRPKGLEFSDELTYLFTALYAEPMVNYEPCDTEEGMSRMHKENVEKEGVSNEIQPSNN